MHSHQVTEEVETLLVEVQRSASELAVLLPMTVHIRGWQVSSTRAVHQHYDALLQKEEHAVAVPTCSGMRCALAFAICVQHLRHGENASK